MKPLSHLDADGRAHMVNVMAKTPTRRWAQVQGAIHLSPDAFAAICGRQLGKGDAFTVAKLAGLQAAKRTDELIPLCHPLPLEHVQIAFIPEVADSTIRIVCETSTTAKTGVEMEAFTATAVAALALYDMVKAVDPGATITGLQLLQKTGGAEDFHRSGACGRP